MNMQKRTRSSLTRFEFLDFILLLFLTTFALLIIIPFYNVIVVSLSTQKQYLTTPVMLFPSPFTATSFKALFEDGRILIGYRTTLLFLAVGLPINLFLTTCLSYVLSRKAFPGRRFFILMVVFTMLFNGGIIPLYLLMKDLRLTNTIWSVIFAYGINTFYAIIMMNYFQTLPESLMESARLDGASEWSILLNIVLPISMPIIATVTLFYSVDRWNEWFNAMIFIRKIDIQPLQLVLRNIVIDSQVLADVSASGTVSVDDLKFTDGIKMSAVIVTILPVMCIFPFLQRYFVKGILVGSIKA